MVTNMAQAVADALKSAQLLPRDAAAKALIEQYAALIDDAGYETLADVGPKLLRALESLGMTPAGRARIGAKEEPDGPVPGEDELEQLRREREERARQHRA